MGELSTSAVHAILYPTLAIFAIIVVLHAKFSLKNLLSPKEDYISARNSRHWLTIAVSIFASSMGNWVLFSIPEVGATSGWWGVLGYILAMVTPTYCVAWFAPYARRVIAKDGFAVSDYMRLRFGRIMEISVGVLTVFVMFIGLTAEYTTIYATLQQLSPTFSPSVAIAAVGVTTLAYTLYSGLSASLNTDKYQAGLIAVLLLITIGAVFGKTEGVTEANFKQFANWTVEGFQGGLLLTIAVLSATVLDQGFFQRVLAAESDRAARIGFCVGTTMTVPFTLLLGIVGFVGKAVDNEGALDGWNASAALFFLLKRLHVAWLVIVLILSISLVCSSIDTQQNGLLACFAGELTANKLAINWARLAAVLLNVPCMYLATRNYSVLTLFLIADLLASATFGPVFLSTWAKTSKQGALAGLCAGIACIFVYGWSLERDFIEGLRFIMLPRGFSDIHSLIIFILVPIASSLPMILQALLWPNKDDSSERRAFDDGEAADGEDEPASSKLSSPKGVHDFPEVPSAGGDVQKMIETTSPTLSCSAAYGCDPRDV